MPEDSAITSSEFAEAGDDSRPANASADRLAVDPLAADFSAPIQQQQLAAGPRVVWDKPPLPGRVGLALGGGAARGAAHIGVLEVLAEYKIPIHCVVGTSAGAIVGGLFAAGIDPARMTAAATGLRWSHISTLSLPSVHMDSLRRGALSLASMSMPLGILDLDRLVDFLDEILGAQTQFTHLSVPFAAIATDIASGEMIVMNDGAVSTAIRASCAIPGIFTPIRRNGRLLIDGGAVNNLPVTVAFQMGAEYVIAVDLLPWEQDHPKEPDNIVELSLMALYSLMRATQRGSQRAHLTLQPAVAHLPLTDLSAAAELIAAGRAATEAAMPEILRALGRPAPDLPVSPI
ncbi:MAG: patatin-like phospholipase family protein [Litorilinea sp.]